MFGRITAVLIISILALGLVGCATQQHQPASNSKGEPANSSLTKDIEGDQSFDPKEDSSNFRLLVSDEVNAIGDFESLNVVVSRIGVHGSGESEGWTEFHLSATNDVTGSGAVSLDLAELQGPLAKEVWSGHVEPGSYDKMFIYVDEVTGVLDGTRDLITVKLPSNKLHLSVPFEVTESSVTNFVYDITVIRAGNQKNGRLKYILKPQIAESGSEVEFEEIEPGESSAQDITAPTIHITGLTDGAEYTGSVTPIFSASDDEDSPEALNLDATLDGAPFVAGTEVSDVGNHTFVVRAEDGSGNVSEMTIEFEILQP